MIRLSVNQAKTHLSKYLDRLSEGETILLCKRNTPVAEIRAVPQVRKTDRPIGLAKNKLKITKSFFKPLPDNLLDAFEGKSRGSYSIHARFFG
jgi:antitoxin (DNA-binding transcriptional repressor) of toxin-antitoxin stability system